MRSQMTRDAAFVLQRDKDKPKTNPDFPGTNQNDIRICDKCRHIRVKTMTAKLKKIAPGAEIKIGCKSYCGPCKRSAFIFINGRYITGATEDEAIEKARKFVK